jgi:hypothetical protein
MIGSVFPWNPEINNEIGEAATRHNATGEVVNCASRRIPSISIVLIRSETAHATRSQKRNGIPVCSTSHPPRVKSWTMKGGWLKTSEW